MGTFLQHVKDQQNPSRFMTENIKDHVHSSGLWLLAYGGHTVVGEAQYMHSSIETQEVKDGTKEQD